MSQSTREQVDDYYDGNPWGGSPLARARLFHTLRLHGGDIDRWRAKVREARGLPPEPEIDRGGF